MRKRNVRQPLKKGVARVPVVMQMESLECGAACLAMVMAYYDKWLPLERVRLDCGVSRDGSNAKNMLKAARSYGLEARGFRMELSAIRESGSFPCVIHWNFNHFVVLCGFRGRYAFINDPARGSLKVTMEEFDRAFTGICLTFAPSDTFVPGGQRESVMAFARRRLTGAGGAVVLVTMMSVLGYLFALLNPAFARFFLDRLLTGENAELLMPFIGLLLLVSFLQILAAVLQAVCSLRINGKMAVIGSSSFMWKLLHLPVEFFAQRTVGDIQTRHYANAIVAQTMVNVLAPLLISAAMMVFYLVVMLRYSLLLTVVGIAAIVLNIAMSRLIALKRLNITRVQMRDAGKLAAATVSGIQMMETIKANGAEDGYFRRWAGYQASVHSQTVSFTRLNQYLGTIPAFVSVLANAAVLVLGVWLCMRGRFTLGMVAAFQSFLMSFMSPAMTLITAGQTFQELRTQMERIEDVMKYPDAPVFSADAAGENTYEKLSGEIELKNVTFGYSRLDEPLITDFSIRIRRGGRVAFVGESGCGKSTLSRLISGLYQPWSGEILFDGRPIGEIDHAVFTGSVAVVDQEITLFEDTVSNNIRLWDNSVESFEMILAARDAQIHDDIVRRPGGYRGRLTEGGRDLSGGQRQRLEIARALTQDPHIIILDEATSALDARTEYELVNAIKDRGITCIVIAHRLSTIRDCDEIIVLDHGKVVERGTHEELYAKGGYYTELITND